MREFRGRMMSVPQIATEVGMNKNTLQDRLRRGLSVEEAVSRPVGGEPMAEAEESASQWLDGGEGDQHAAAQQVTNRAHEPGAACDMARED